MWIHKHSEGVHYRFAMCSSTKFKMWFFFGGREGYFLQFLEISLFLEYHSFFEYILPWTQGWMCGRSVSLRVRVPGFPLGVSTYCVCVSHSVVSDSWDPMDCSLPGSHVHRILQARILEWVAIPFSRVGFPTPSLNLGHLHCRQILYHLSHQRSP